MFTPLPCLLFCVPGHSCFHLVWFHSCKTLETICNKCTTTSSLFILSFLSHSTEGNPNLRCYMCNIFKRKLLIVHLLLQDSEWKRAFLHLSSECVIVSFDCRDIGTLTFSDIASKFWLTACHSAGPCCMCPSSQKKTCLFNCLLMLLTTAYPSC